MPWRVRVGGTDPGEERAQHAGNLRFHLANDGNKAGGAEPSKDWLQIIGAGRRFSTAPS